MSSNTRINAALEKALHLPLDQNSRYILMSDCHRGCGTANDNFLKNEYLYLAALEYYFDHGFTYIELGDGDELWENRSMKCIREMHPESFALLEKFSHEGRMYAIYGNHDMVKKCRRFRKENPSDLPPSYPGIILKDEEQKADICLLHGHQADMLNSTLWRLSRFLVRYIWRLLEALGIPDPTSAAKNNTKKKKSEKILTQWAKEKNCILICGHTHHPMIGFAASGNCAQSNTQTEAKDADSPYCNTGSCVHPYGITGIEIQNRCMSLVKWSMSAREDLTLYVSREILGETVCIDEYPF